MNTLTGYFARIKGDSEIGVDWARSVGEKGKKGFILTNNSISVLLRLLAKVLGRTKIPAAHRSESWKNQLGDWVISPVKAYLNENVGADGLDPYKDLRRDLTSEGARKGAAQTIWERSPLSNSDFQVTY